MAVCPWCVCLRHRALLLLLLLGTVCRCCEHSGLLICSCRGAGAASLRPGGHLRYGCRLCQSSWLAIFGCADLRAGRCTVRPAGHHCSCWSCEGHIDAC